MTESPSQQGRRFGINLNYWTLKRMGNVGSLNSFFRVECSTAQHCILCNKLLSLGLSFIIKAASASLASDFTHILKDLVLWLSAKILNAFYSWEVILPCCLVPVETCSWDGTWPHVLCREHHLTDKVDPSTELLTWGATIFHPSCCCREETNCMTSLSRTAYPLWIPRHFLLHHLSAVLILSAFPCSFPQHFVISYASQ